MTAHVRVPASSSNLGAGFDCIGVAVDRWLVAWLTPTAASEERSLIPKSSRPTRPMIAVGAPRRAAATA